MEAEIKCIFAEEREKSRARGRAGWKKEAIHAAAVVRVFFVFIICERPEMMNCVD